MSGNHRRHAEAAAITPEHDEHNRAGYRIHCSVAGCGESEFVRVTQNCPPLAITQKFQPRGWEVVRDGRSATCPKCVAARKARRAGPSPPGPPPMPIDSTPEARRATRRMNELLAAHFEEPSQGAAYGRYAKDWSDERVAKECGLSVAEVGRYRDDAFGRVEAPALVNLRRDLEIQEGKVQAAIAKLAEDVTAQRSLLDEFERTERAKLEAALADLGKLRRRTEAVAAAGGAGR